MKYYVIVPAFGKEKIQGIFRVNDQGIPERWYPETKTWVFQAFLHRFFTGDDIGYREMTLEEANELILK